jgi:hypothetical protein
MARLRYLVILGLLAVPPSLARAQDEEKARKFFQDAIQAMGGEAYLNVKDMISEGNYFLYTAQGDHTGLIKYNDFTVLPDKSRFELGNKKKERDITVFNLQRNEGWILDYPKDVRAATPAEIKEFGNEVKHNIDNIFRFRWNDPANKLFLMGPGEGADMTLEMVQILDSENDDVTVYFDRMSKLPMKIEHRSVNKMGIQERNIQEFSQWHVTQGVNTPLRVDGFVNKRRKFQSFIIKIEYNTNVPESFFTKPEQAK